MLQQLEFQLQTLGVSLKTLADFINYLPFFVSIEELQQFIDLNAYYQELHSRYSAIATAVHAHRGQLNRETLRAELENFCQANRKAYHVVLSVMQKCVDVIKPEITIVVRGETLNVRDNLLKIMHTHEFLYAASFNGVPLQVYLEQKQTLEKDIATLLGLVGGVQASLLKSLQFKHISRLGVVGKALRDDFYRAKELQHSLYSVSRAQTDFRMLYRGFKINIVSVGELLPKESYIDLALLTHLLRPERVCQALANKLAILQFNHEQLQGKISSFAHLNIVKLFRVQRIITAYEDWLKILQEQQPKIEGSDLMAALFIQQLLTYEKKALLTKLFQTQTLSRVVSVIEKILPKLEGKTSEQIYAYFYTEKAAIQQKVREIETKIRANQTYWQAILATAVLGVTRQPEYQLGQLAAAFNVHLFDQFPTLPIIGEQLPPHILTKLYHSVGASFLGISMYASNRFGYSYQLIAFINRILLAQVDILIKLGSYGEKVAQRTCQPLLDALKKITPTEFVSTIDWLKETICFDELGIIEKERFINWTAGLGIQAGMTLGHNVAPALIGYTSGTFFAEAAGTAVEYLNKDLDLSDTTLTSLKVMSHFIAYSYAYSYAYRWSAMWLAESTEQIAQKQAFAIFGLDQNARIQDVKDKYHELALKHHTDICRAKGGVDCKAENEEMLEINAAYELLKKKLI